MFRDIVKSLSIMQELLIIIALFILSLLLTAGRVFNEFERIKYLQALTLCNMGIV